jgi:dinuclear metal center YbgI/SA1388 family protein
MIDIEKIEAYCNELLSSSSFKDASYNGIQVLNNKDIKKIVTGVSATEELFKKANEVGASLVLTHHGIYWKGGDPRLVGILNSRVKALKNISLMAYHLPLDAHLEIGNNALIAKRINAKVEGYFPVDTPDNISLKATLNNQSSCDDIKKMLDISEGKKEVVVINPKGIIKNVVICTGEGGFNFDFNLDGIDAIITGEISERHYHLAIEKNVTMFLIGHHYSEVLGIKGLGEKIAEEFGIEHEFIDIYSPF